MRYSVRLGLLVTVIASSGLQVRATETADTSNRDAIAEFLKENVIEQKLWDLDKNRERLNPDTPRIKSRVLTSRVQVSQRKSTGEVIGYSVITGNSLTDSSASAMSVRLALIKTKDGIPALQVVDATVLYSDHFGKDDKSTPGCSRSELLLWVKDDLLQAK